MTEKTNILVENMKFKLDREFWDETYKSTIMRQIETGYKIEIIRDYGISDLVINGDNVLIKWYKRLRSLSDEELMEKFGRIKDDNDEDKLDG